MSFENIGASQSLTRRLKAFMFAIAFFFIVGAVGVYFSSVSFFDGVQRINSANAVLSITTISMDSLDSSSADLEKIINATEDDDTHFLFSSNIKILKDSIVKSIEASDKNLPAQGYLKESLDSINRFEDQAELIFARISKSAKPLAPKLKEELKSEILVAMQFSMDARELLRKTQIQLNVDSEKLFNNIYNNRFRTIVVAFSLSAIFFFFVITTGFGIADKIRISVINLLHATDRVSEGDLDFQAKIFHRDEFGHLTSTFNKMLISLKEGRSELDITLARIQRLQAITAKFSQALTMDEVMEVTINEGLKLLDVNVGAFYIYDPETEEMETRKFLGLSEERVTKWHHFPVNLNIPVTHAFHQRKPVFIENIEEGLEKFPHIEYEIKENHISAMVALPIIIGETCLGVLFLEYDKPKEFKQPEKEFLMAIASYCAQALHRSLLYDDSRKAIHVRDEFLSIASHELKTPLTPLKLQLQLLSKQLKEGKVEFSPEKILKIIENADKQLNRLSRLIEDLLDVSRITSGKFKLNLEILDLAKIISDVLTQYGEQINIAKNHLRVEVEENIYCNVDQIRIEQVLINLLMNAVKYAPGNPITISLKRFENKARLTVIDGGPGISKLDQERIFKRFERIATTNNVGGLGLGLYISHQIIEAHNGKISVKSELGKGASFIIELPAV